MLDIIEIALDRLTDFSDFEKLACEVLQNEGYPDIKPLGGSHDFAQDATVERLYCHSGKRLRTIFQITTQEALESKLQATIRRLDEASAEYQQLILVTSREVTTPRETELVRLASQQDVSLRVYGKKTIVNRLADVKNGIFHRHFPNIETQVQVLLGSVPAEQLEPKSVVRAALAFASSYSEFVRHRVFDELILSLLMSRRGNEINIEEIARIHGEMLPQARALETDQITSSVKRLVRVGLAEPAANGYQPTKEGIERCLASSLALKHRQHSLAVDVSETVERIMGEELDETTKGLIERNASDALGRIFRLMGLEASSQILGRRDARRAQIGSHEAINEAARRDLRKPLSDVTAAAIADLIESPSEEQAEALAAYAYGYVGASLIEVDPAVRELQADRMATKTFILDTDFLVDCVVPGRPVHEGSIALLEAVVNAGARVIVPNDCIVEAALHAARAHRTVAYFGARIFGLSPAQATERIHNAFAAGWYFRNRQSRVRFEDYISDFYDERHSETFMAHVVATALPDEVEIGDAATLLGVSPDAAVLGTLSAEMMKVLTTSRKSPYRTDQETQTLASTDAKLYATALAFANQTAYEGDAALAGTCYLITSSHRFIRAVEEALGTPDQISARPMALLSLFKIIGKAAMGDRDFVRLFDNPLLQEAVFRCREDADLLLDAGMSTSDVGLARLTWDLDQDLHERIAAATNSERRAESTLTEEDEIAAAESFVDLVNGARRRGYRPQAASKAILDELQTVKADNTSLVIKVNELTERLTNFESEIGFFGKRRQRYLMRIAQGTVKPARRPTSRKRR
jgi:hypothetical protein